ncbi:MAG: hypothetical protein AMXMBFR13_23750 [Phycisphaerae bacterium]
MREHLIHAFLLASIVWLNSHDADAAGSTTSASSTEESATARMTTGGPDGYELAAYLDCGAATQAGQPVGPRIVQKSGTPRQWPGAAVDAGAPATAASDAREVVYELAGLQSECSFVLGFTWWDFDLKGRQQSVRFGVGDPVKWKTVLPAAPAVAWYQDKATWAQIYLPIPAGLIKDRRLLVSFHRDGPADAVVSEVCLLRKRIVEGARPSPLKRVVIVTGDDYPGHLWRQTAPEIAAILRKDPRLEVTITESPALLASPLMGEYDAAVLHYMNWQGRPDPGEQVRKGLEEYVRSGHGLVLVHFACGAFQSWSGFVKVAGRVWDPKLRGHDPRGPFDVGIIDREHPITAGMEGFRTDDELYTCLVGEPPIRVLAEATSSVDKKPYPMGFVHELGRGRVFHTPLGHDVTSFKAEGTRELIRRATAWVVRLEPRSLRLSQ